MAGQRVSGPQGVYAHHHLAVIDDGTLARTATSRPGPWAGSNRAGVGQAREVRAYDDFLLPVSGAYDMLDSGDAD